MIGRFWLQALLAISLAFNVAVVVMHCCIEPPPPAHGPEAFEKRITHDMSSEDAAIVHRAFASHQAEFAQRKVVMDGAIDNVRKALQASPVKQDELKAAMDNARTAKAVSETVMEQVMLDSAKDLSPEGRLKLLPPPPPRNH